MSKHKERAVICGSIGFTCWTVSLSGPVAIYPAATPGSFEVTQQAPFDLYLLKSKSVSQDKATLWLVRLNVHKLSDVQQPERKHFNFV